jgi:hypothetical protein
VHLWMNQPLTDSPYTVRHALAREDGEEPASYVSVSDGARFARCRSRKHLECHRFAQEGQSHVP